MSVSKPHSEPLQPKLDAMRERVTYLRENWKGEPEVAYAISDVQAAVEAFVPVVRKLQADNESLEEQLDLARSMLREKGVDPADLVYELEKVLGV